MTTEMIDILEVIVFAVIGGFSFMSGYLTRYFLGGDYDNGYCDGFADGRKIQQQLHDLTK